MKKVRGSPQSKDTEGTEKKVARQANKSGEHYICTMMYLDNVFCLCFFCLIFSLQMELSSRMLMNQMLPLCEEEKYF